MNYLSKENMLEVLELSRLQESLTATLDQDTSDRHLIQTAYVLDGAIDALLLEQALNAVVSAHPELRSVFRPLKNRVVQAVLKHRPVSLDVHDYGSKVDEIAAGQRAPLDIGTGPLLRAALVLQTETQAVLLVTHHALILDSESLESFVQEWMMQYESFSEKNSSTEPVNRSRYSAYLKWLTRQDWMPAKEFWRAQAGELVPSLMLTTLRRGLGLGRCLQGVQELSPELSNELRVLAERAGVSEKAVAAAAWALLASLYSGEERVTFGWRASGRVEEVERAGHGLGPFSNSLPLGTSTAGEQSLREYLQTMNAKLSRLEAAAYLPEAEARLDANVANGVLLYDTSLSFGAPANFAWQGFSLTRFWEISATKAPLQVEIEAGDTWRVRWSYAEAQLSADVVGQLQSQWRTLLQSMAAAQTSDRLCDLALVSDEERAQLADFNVSAQSDPDLSLLAHQVIERQVAQTPDTVAVRCRESSLTYAELNAEANKLAWQLRGLGFGRDDVAALFAERDIEMLIGILGVLKAGGAYVPLDTANPVARNRTVVENSRARVVLTQAPFVSDADVLADGLATVVVNLSNAAARAGESIDNPPFQNEPGDLANVFYTSGSTGLPKGAMVEHIGMLNHLYAKINLVGLTSEGVVAQTASHCFDISVWQFLAPLMVGGVTVIYQNAVSMDPEALLDTVRLDGVTDLELVPAMMEMMWRAAEERGGVNLPALRHLIATGEGLPTELSNRWHRSFPNVRMINAYGASETSDDFTHEVVEGLVPEDRPYVSLGTVIPHHSVYVLDRFLRQVPIGGIGEICVTGIGVGRGYLHDPERTAKAFLENPFDDGRGARLYRTGDLGYYRPDGKLMYISRVDFQVKVRGHRIELGEVEAALRKHPHVDQCVAIVRKDDTGQNRLLAYVVTTQATDPTELRDHLKQWVPEYMIPEAVTQLEQLPLNQNGKIDRKALPDPDLHTGSAEVTAPRNESEVALVQIWEDVLGVSGLGIDQNFFQLGGHSLKTIQVRARIKKQFGVELPLHQLFEYQTVRELAELLGVPPVEGAGGEGTTIPKLPPSDIYPMSYSQRRLFFLQRMKPEDITWNMPSLVELEGELDHRALVRAFERVMERHDVLRTTYEMQGNDFFQRVHPQAKIECPLIDLSALSEDEREAVIRECADQETLKPFDLTTDSLLRLRVFRIGPDRHRMLLVMHHILTDFWSWGVLTREFQEYYAAEREGRDAVLPPLSVQYTDYSAWQNELLQGGGLRESEQYWLDTLGGDLPELDLPTDHPRPPMMTSAGDQVKFRIEAPLASKLQALTDRGDATLFLVLLSAAGVLLSRLSGQRDIVFGTPEAGRNLLELEGLIGFFVNTLPLRIKLTEGQSFLQLLEDVKQTALQAYEHHEYPFDQMVDLVNPVRDMGRTPIFSVLFQVRRAGEDRFQHEAGGLRMRPLEMEVTATKQDLQIDFVEQPDALECMLTYRTDLYEKATVERWMSHLILLLEEISDRPEAPVETLSLLGPEERQEVLHRWNDTDVEYPEDSLAYDFVEEQVDRTPDAVALICEEETLTYREFDERVNRLANYLRLNGVGPEVRVGLYLERSVEMVIAIHAILKAGGAYVPMDLSHPSQRIYDLLEGANLNLVVTVEKLREMFAESGLPVITLDGAEHPWREMSAERPPRTAHPHNLIYIFHTSGSTGKPKGVMNEHGPLCHMLQWLRDAYPLTAEDRVLFKTQYTFDVSLWELFLPFMRGAALVVAREQGHRDPFYMKQVIQEQQVTWITLVPSALQMMFEQVDFGTCDSLRHLILIGEKVKVDLQEKFFQTFDRAQLYNLYGPTECSVHASAWVCERTDTRRFVPLGAPISNTKLYVVDQHLEPVPIGVIGELIIGGKIVGRGYNNLEAKTAEAFLPDPFTQTPGARMYRTGDLVRRHADGTLEYLDRADHQVKLRGFRIELGDIESALLALPDVKQAAALIQKDDGLDLLVAYVVTDAEKDVRPTDLRDRLADKLPEYMLPNRFVFLESFPLNAAQKLDRKALQALDTGGPSLIPQREYSAPRTSAERELVRIFEKVLSVEPVGVHDDFFALGGHSMKVLGVLGAMQEFFKLTFPVAGVYQRPTVAKLAEWIEELILDNQERPQALLEDGALLIQQGTGNRPPVFFVHGQGGGISSFFPLAKQMGLEETVYAFQAFGYESEEEPYTSMIEIAKRYTDEMMRVQPKGPYRIIGWSFGGTVAYETARCLEQRGEKVEILGLFDAIPMDQPDDHREKKPWTNLDVMRFALVDLGLDTSILDGHDEEEAFPYVMDAMVRSGRFPLGVPEASMRAKLRVMAAHGTASVFYTYTGPIETDLHLFNVTESTVHNHPLVDPEDWKPRTKGAVHVYQVQGDHNSMLDTPYLPVLVEAMREAFQSTSRTLQEQQMEKRW